MEKIDTLIDGTPFTEPVQRGFYKVMIRERKERILDYSMEQMAKRTKNK